MGYTLPLRFIRVSKKRSDTKQFDVAICATRIVAMMSTDIYQARRTISDEKKAGTLINAAGISAVKTAIFLDNGSVVASPLTVPVLMNSIAKSNERGAKRQTPRLKVYDVYDNEDEIEEEDYINEISASNEVEDNVEDEDEDEEDFDDEY